MKIGIEDTNEKTKIAPSGKICGTLLPILMLMSLLASAAANASEAQNFLLNGTFEGGADVPGWARSFWVLEKPWPTLPPVDQCLSRSTEQAHGGAWSLKVDTGKVLDQEVALMFIGKVDLAAAKTPSGKLILSGWVYIEPGTAVRP
ncbi:MAG: hypothetical protein M3Y56_07135, partial [Armatimonadota bacterium]|nr:hypothetical protein [Armatimonadota bacterium]